MVLLESGSKLIIKERNFKYQHPQFWETLLSSRLLRVNLSTTTSQFYSTNRDDALFFYDHLRAKSTNKDLDIDEVNNDFSNPPPISKMLPCASEYEDL